MKPQLTAPIDTYARVSKKGDKEQRSTTGQVAVCLGILTARDLPPGMVHVDDGRSAWNPKVRRDGFEALMARLENGAAGGCIVFDLERFSRKPIDGERLIAAAERGLLVLDSDGEFDLTTSSGKKSFRDAMAAAAYYSDRLSDRTRRGKRDKALAGEPNGSRRPFGFEDDMTTVREDEAAVLRELTRRMLDGEAQGPLVAELNQRGILTTQGKRWSVPTLKMLLTRQRNAGRLAHKGVVVGQLPGKPIIEPDDFDRLCAVYAARRRGRPNSPAYLCTGSAVCGKCGGPMRGRPRSAMQPYPDKSVRRDYWCVTCGGITADQRAVDAVVGELVIEILADPRHAAAVEAAARTARTETAKLDAEIEAAEELGDELAGKLGRGELSRRRYDATAGPLEKRLERLKEARRAVAVPPEAPPIAESREAWQRRWRDATPDQRRLLLRMALRGRRIVIRAAAGRTASGRFEFDADRVALTDS